MERTPVESSQIKSIGHEVTYYEEDFLDGEKKEFGIAEVEFKGGSVYEYGNFPKDLFAQWMAAESKGKFFGEFIKPFPDRYPFKRTRGTDKEEAKKRLDEMPDGEERKERVDQ